jgi:hypothetical protein
VAIIYEQGNSIEDLQPSMDESLHLNTNASLPVANRKRRRDDTQRSERVYPRKRAITACRLCRYRKVKCNNQRPICGACADSNASCVYDDAEDHSVFDPASLKILERIDQVLSRLDQIPSISTATLPSINASIATNSTVQACSPPLAKNLNSHEEDDALDEDRWMPSARTNVEAVLAWPIFATDSQGSAMLEAIYGTETEENDQSVNTRSGGIIEEDIPRLVQRFIEFVHLKNPVVDVETLWFYTHQIVEDGINWSASSCLVVS